ncbi:MAG: response regulator transcription factor [Candidatus Woesearchaeota archaeon]
MKELNKDIKEKIIKYLKTKKIGASANDISKKINHNRITVTKYLEILNATNKISFQEVAQAKLWKLNEENNNPKILIIDDEPNVVELITLSLISSKYQINKAYSGYEGLKKAKSLIPDLIILDLMMPTMDGFQVCEELKKDITTKNIPIIILSAKYQTSDKLLGLKKGANDYITKPFDPMELEARVNSLIRRVNKDIDTNPITKLPGIESLKNKIEEKINNDKTFNIFKIEIINLEKYKQKYGYRKIQDLFIILSRVFLKKINVTNSNIYHIPNDNFIVISKDEKIDLIINEAFNEIIPYLTNNNDKNISKHDKNEVIKLKINKINLKEKNIKTIYKLLKID